MTKLQAEASIVINWKEEKDAFNKRIESSILKDHQEMLAALHARCEARKRALREERFWNEILEEAQQQLPDFEY